MASPSTKSDALSLTGRIEALRDEWMEISAQLHRESEAQPDRQRAIYCDGKAMAFKSCSSALSALLASGTRQGQETAQDAAGGSVPNTRIRHTDALTGVSDDSSLPAASSASSRPSGWQPIETGTGDGERRRCWFLPKTIGFDNHMIVWYDHFWR